MKMSKNMKLSLACTAIMLSISGAAFAQEQQRVVVSYEVAGGEVSAQSQSVKSKTNREYCLSLTSGNTWCVPAPSQVSKVRAASQSNDTARIFSSQVVSVPEELSLEQAVSMLKQTGFYAAVEQDVAISVQGWNETDPNEQYFAEQYYFLDNSVENPTASSVLTQWSMLKNPEKIVNAYVLDTGFHLSDDLSYADGFNFESGQSFSKPGPGFLELDFIPEGSTCHNMHGLGVSSVIGAKINNGIGVTGTTGDVVIHPLRVMHCGTGYMSDAANALNWLSGQSFEGFPDFTGEPGVVNMSLGGHMGESECPLYLQSAIDNVTAKGFTVVVAAGNQSDDASLYIPAKCDNVITVGAATDKSRDADIAKFSNYGATLDVMAVGQEVLGLRKDNGIGYWDGTSLASPLVAGIILNASKDFDLKPAEWQLLMSISSVDRWVEGAECDVKGCASGVLDAGLLYANAQKLIDGELDSLTLSLNAVPACRQAWMIANLSKGTALCDQAVINMGTMSDLMAGEYIEVHALSSGQSIEDRTGFVGQYDEAVIVLDKSVFADKTAFVLRCKAEGECGSPVQLSTTALNDTPEACQ